MINDNVGSSTLGEWPESLDALTAAPDHHAVLLENDRVRVLDTRIGPGQRTSVHTHAWPSVLYVLGWSDFIRFDGDANMVLDSRTLASRPEKGTALWSPILGPHFVRNVGNEELRVIAVELKSPRA
jgi:mannose-6-phosphate isomerase-like protein (cupin superfamily)